MFLNRDKHFKLLTSNGLCLFFADKSVLWNYLCQARIIGYGLDSRQNRQEYVERVFEPEILLFRIRIAMSSLHSCFSSFMH